MEEKGDNGGKGEKNEGKGEQKENTFKDRKTKQNNRGKTGEPLRYREDI